MMDIIGQYDFFALDALAGWRTPFATQAMSFITFLGDKGVFWAGCALMLCCFKKTRATGVLMLTALAATYLIGTLGLKNLFARARPCAVFPQKTFLFCPNGPSFPSGHAFSSFAAAGVLFFRREKGAVFALVLAFLIAFSRVYLYVHFPTDVLTGGVMGFLGARILVGYCERYDFFRR